MDKTWIGALALAATAAAAAPDAAGRWEGTADIPGAPLPLVIDLARDGAGGWRGSVILPGRGVKGARLAPLAVDGDGVQAGLAAAFTIPAEPAPALALRWRGDGTLGGVLRQGGHEAPLTLARSGPPQVDQAPATPLTDAMAGRWRGRYELGGQTRDVTLVLTRKADGSGGGELTVVGRRTTTLAVEQVVSGRRFVTIEAASGFRIEGTWRAGTIDGRVVQGPFEAPLTLVRDGGAS